MYTQRVLTGYTLGYSTALGKRYASPHGLVHHNHTPAYNTGSIPPVGVPTSSTHRYTTVLYTPVGVLATSTHRYRDEWRTSPYYPPVYLILSRCNYWEAGFGSNHSPHGGLWVDLSRKRSPHALILYFFQIRERVLLCMMLRCWWVTYLA